MSCLLVVYRTIPTSNHNLSVHASVFAMLYIVLFLHQTTTAFEYCRFCSCCISYYSYIKPQLLICLGNFLRVVYRTIPTSNHNLEAKWNGRVNVVYRTIPTSNHNFLELFMEMVGVVYRTIPTSNHNPRSFDQKAVLLYIVLFLHQTTTVDLCYPRDLELYIVLFLHQTTTYLHSKPSK